MLTAHTVPVLLTVQGWRHGSLFQKPLTCDEKVISSFLNHERERGRVLGNTAL